MARQKIVLVAKKVIQPKLSGPTVASECLLRRDTVGDDHISREPKHNEAETPHDCFHQLESSTPIQGDVHAAAGKTQRNHLTVVQVEVHGGGKAIQHRFHHDTTIIHRK
eukprot:scaffold804_cov165-Amphora_coffeaeformis.AAC.21